MVLAMSFPKTSPRRAPGRDIVGVLAVALGSCAIAFGFAGCGNTDERPATWSFISTAILEPSCATASCHSSLAQRAGVDLSTRDVGYESLVTRKFALTDADVPDADERVTRSTVLRLMRADGSQRMPPDAPLPEADIQLVERWIRDGAKKN
jgi:hypothetical protein